MKLILASLSLFLVLTAPTDAMADTKRRDFLLSQIESCEAILRETMANPARAIPRELLQQARGIAVINQFQAGLIFGGRGGYGIVMVRQPDTGRWSLPCFLDAREASIGLQLGAKSVETIYLLMDDEAVRLLFNSRFNLGVDARAVAGPMFAGEEHSTDFADVSVLVYTSDRGLYAGATVKTGNLRPNNRANREFYTTEFMMPEILFSDWVTPPREILPLMEYVQKITR